MCVKKVFGRIVDIFSSDWWLRLWRFPPLQNYPLPTSCLTWRSRQRRQQMMETWKTNLGRVIPLGPGLFVVDQDPMSSTDPNCGLWWRSHPLSNASNPNHPPAHTGIRMTSTKNWPEWIKDFFWWWQKPSHIWIEVLGTREQEAQGRCLQSVDCTLI